MWSFLSNYCKDTKKKEKTSKISQITPCLTCKTITPSSSSLSWPLAVLPIKYWEGISMPRDPSLLMAIRRSSRHRLRNPTCASEKPRDMINPWGKVVKVNMFWSTTYFLFETKNAKPCKLSTQSDFDKMLQNVNPSDLKSKALIQLTRSFGFVQPTLQIPLHMISLLWRNFVTHQTQTPWVFFFRQSYRMLSFPSPSGNIWSSLGSRSIPSIPSLLRFLIHQV